MNRTDIGRDGEELARSLLQEKGYRILDRNCRSRLGEIDLVCRDRDTVVFVEVKTRTSDEFGQPAEAVGALKQARLRRLAREYIAKNGLEASPARFDVIGIRLDCEPPDIEHIENAF